MWLDALENPRGGVAQRAEEVGHGLWAELVASHYIEPVVVARLCRQVVICTPAMNNSELLR